MWCFDVVYVFWWNVVGIHLCVFVCVFVGLITTTSRRLDREKQSEHILEVRESGGDEVM